MSDETHSIVVVGAGAAGLWAAIAAAEQGARVLVLEKTARAGTKILASGGTRCNLTTTLAAGDAARLFRRRGERFLRHAFQELAPGAVRARFEEWGVPTVEAPLDKVFPASQSARDVRDALEREARARSVELRFECAVESLARDGDLWVLRTSNGGEVRARRVLLAAGGQSFAGSGTTGDGYAWLADLGLPLVERTPALAPLVSQADWVAELAGIAWQTGSVRLLHGGRVLGERVRPLLFTHRGVSGPAAMDLSVHVARVELEPDAEPLTLAVDFYPEISRDELRERCISAARERGRPRLQRLLAEPLPRRLFTAVARQAQLASPDPYCSELSKAERHRFIETLKGFEIPIQTTEGYDKAEVTAGGLELSCVDPRSMQVNGQPGLYVFGELLDLDGPIGGLNFQAAFACGEVAGRHAGEAAARD